MRNEIAMTSVIVCALLAEGLAAQSTGLGARVGTLGLGGELAVAIGERTVVRAGAGVTPFDAELSLGGIGVTAKVPTLYNVGLDAYLNGALRIGGGVLLARREPTIRAVFTQNQEIGGQTFTPQEIGTLVGVIESRNTAPYALIGFGRHTASEVGLFVDFGVAFMGEPGFRLDAVGGSLSSQSGPLRDALDGEEQEFQDDAGPYLRFWPIFNLGLRIGGG